MKGKNLDQMLAQWPTPERTALDWDEAAAAVTGRLAEPAKTRGVLSDDVLFASPLPAEAGEGPGAVEKKMGNSQEPKGKRSSFAELAKLAGSPSLTPAPPQTGVTRAAEGSKDDSGIVDLKIIASLDPGAAERAKTAPLAAEGLFDDDAKPAAPVISAAPPPVVSSAAPPPVSSGAPPAVSMPPVSSAPVSAAPVSAASAAPAASPSTAPAPVAAVPAPAPKKEKKEGGGGVVIVLGGLFAAAAIAAGVFLFIRSQGDLPMFGGKKAPEPEPVAKVAPPPATTEAPPPPQPAASAVALQEPVPIDTVPVPDTKHAPTTKVPAGGGAVATKPTAPPPDPKLQVKELSGGTAGNSDDLASAMQKAAGGPVAQGQDKSTSAAAIPANAPQKPSQGQVAGAIGSVLPEARACLGPDDPVGTATVVFQSDGSVQSVSVSSKVGADCIKAALGKAKVPPFHEATFSFPVKVRPNG